MTADGLDARLDGWFFGDSVHLGLEARWGKEFGFMVGVRTAGTQGLRVAPPVRTEPRGLLTLRAVCEPNADVLRLFAIDEDGVLWTIQHRPHKETIEAIQKKQSLKGILCEASFEWSAWTRIELNIPTVKGQRITHVEAIYSAGAHLELFFLIEDGTLCHSWSTTFGDVWIDPRANFQQAPKLRSIWLSEAASEGVEIYGIGRDNLRGYTNGFYPPGGWAGEWKEL